MNGTDLVEGLDGAMSGDEGSWLVRELVGEGENLLCGLEEASFEAMGWSESLSLPRQSPDTARDDGVGVGNAGPDVQELGKDPRPFRELSSEERSARLEKVMGVGRGLMSTSEEFAKRKREEIEIEVLTSDHHELDRFAQAAICPIRFIR